MDCFSVEFPNSSLDIFKYHPPALGDTLHYGGTRAISGTSAVTVENVFDSCSRGDDDDCLVEDFQGENVPILSGPFGESIELSISSP